MAALPTIPRVLHTHSNATTASGDTRLTIVSLHVTGAGDLCARTWIQGRPTTSFVKLVYRYCLSTPQYTMSLVGLSFGRLMLSHAAFCSANCR